MGRIADALRRAEEERRQAVGMAAGEASCAVLEPEPPRAADPRGAHLGIGSDGPGSEPIPLVEGLSESLVPLFERSSLITEQYRSLRTRLLSQNPHYEHRVLAITSAVPKEGKSVTTVNLGCILSEIRHLKVLVVDGDFRRGSLAHMLNQEDSPGLAEVLTGDVHYSKAIRKTPIPNMMFMPAGDTHGRSAAELLASVSTQPVFARMRNEFHYTIVDTPPATTVTDVGIIGQVCNGVVIVVRLHHTDDVTAKRAVRLLQVNNVPIVGCLLIGRDAPPGRYGYGYGCNYYRYYAYYRQGEEEA